MTPEYRGTLRAGYLLEEYRLERVLGQGGFGITYLAHDTQLEQQVAIKEYLPREFAVREADSSVLPRSSADEPAFRRGLDRFLKEARTLARLRHRNIVRVLRYFEGLGTAYLVMEYETGKSLEEVLRALGAPAEEAWIRALLFPLLDGLEAVHAADLLHRDIKPGNIFVRSDGVPLLLDFGAALSAQAAADAGTTFYTPGYAPLEQYGTEGSQGPWSDIYGMAAVFYRMTTGKRPLDAPRRAAGGTFEAAAEIGRARYDARLLRAIDWGLRLDARARPQSVAEWRNGRGEEPGLGMAGDSQIATTVIQPRTGAQPSSDARPSSGAQPPLGAARGARSPQDVRGHRARAAAVGLLVLVVAVASVLYSTWPERSVAPEPETRAEPSARPLARRPDAIASGSMIGALGMVDAEDSRYVGKPDLLLADLRTDARRQVLEKAVSIFVERAALFDRYEPLERDIIGRGELVDRLVDSAQPRGTRGLVYLAAAADVRLQDLRKIVYRLSREQRIALIRTQGDPLISVAVSVRDAERGSPIERSALAENVIKERIRDFGFRVTSPMRDAGDGAAMPAPDFTVESEAKLKRLRTTLAASGLTIEKYVLTSWTVKCLERTTGEEIYFDNRLPESGSWADEDRALREIGTLIADAFSRDLFAQHLPRESRHTRLTVHALPSPEAADLLRLELLSLRSVVQVDMSEPAGDTATFLLGWYDQGPGGEQSLDGTVLSPLRRKLGGDCLAIESERAAEDVVVRLPPSCAQSLLAKLQDLPAAALGEGEAAPSRLAALARSVTTMRKLALLNPDGVNALAEGGLPLAREALVPEAATRQVEM